MADETGLTIPEGTAAEYPHSSGHDGHRIRMLHRYQENGLAGFREHEVLEMLLFRSIPRSNTNPLAHEMLDNCGSMEAVLEQAADEGSTVPGAGTKTMEMLQDTREALESCFRDKLMQSGHLDKWQLYTAAVWFLRRYPERILLVVCDPHGKPEEIGTFGETEPAVLLENLRCFVQPDMLCHIACTGREEELARLRKCRTGVRMGMFLSLSEQWVPTWK